MIAPVVRDGEEEQPTALQDSQPFDDSAHRIVDMLEDVVRDQEVPAAGGVWLQVRRFQDVCKRNELLLCQRVAPDKVLVGNGIDVFDRSPTGIDLRRHILGSDLHATSNQHAASEPVPAMPAQARCNLEQEPPVRPDVTIAESGFPGRQLRICHIGCADRGSGRRDAASSDRVQPACQDEGELALVGATGIEPVTR